MMGLLLIQAKGITYKLSDFTQDPACQEKWGGGFHDLLSLPDGLSSRAFAGGREDHGCSLYAWTSMAGE